MPQTSPTARAEASAIVMSIAVSIVINTMLLLSLTATTEASAINPPLSSRLFQPLCTTLESTPLGVARFDVDLSASGGERRYRGGIAPPASKIVSRGVCWFMAPSLLLCVPALRAWRLQVATSPCSQVFPLPDPFVTVARRVVGPRTAVWDPSLRLRN